MAHSRKDARHGHRPHMYEDFNTPGSKRFMKRTGRRNLRREAVKATAAAIADYEDDIEEAQREWFDDNWYDDTPMMMDWQDELVEDRWIDEPSYAEIAHEHQEMLEFYYGDASWDWD